MTIIDTAPLWTGRLGKKTKGLKALSLSVAVFESAAKYLTIKTLEGYIPIDRSCLLCVGEADEPWQQLPHKIEKDYDMVGTEGAWDLYMPKPTKIVEFIEVTEELLRDTLNIPPAAPTFIVGLWGETIDGIANLQRVRQGDFIARQLDQHEDQWVVQRSIWLRTYEEVFNK